MVKAWTNQTHAALGDEGMSARHVLPHQELLSRLAAQTAETTQPVAPRTDTLVRKSKLHREPPEPGGRVTPDANKVGVFVSMPKLMHDRVVKIGKDLGIKPDAVVRRMVESYLYGTKPRFKVKSGSRVA